MSREKIAKLIIVINDIMIMINSPIMINDIMIFLQTKVDSVPIELSGIS